MKKSSFILSLLIFTFLCVYLFIAFYNEAEKTAIRQLNINQQIQAQQAAQGISDFFQTWRGILTAFANMDEIITFDDAGKRKMAHLYAAYREQILSITRVDEKGVILSTLPQNSATGSDISGQTHMRKIISTHQPVVSDVFRTVQGEKGVALHLPVFKGTIFRGTIAVVIDFESLTKRYLQAIKVGKTGYAWVISQAGTTLYSPIPGFAGKSILLEGRDYPSLLAMVQEMLQGHRGTAVYTFDRVAERQVAGVKKYAVYMPVFLGNRFWSLAVASAEDEVFSSLAAFRNRLLLVIGLILLGGVFFSVVSLKAWLVFAAEKKRRLAEQGLREAEAGLRESEQFNRLLFDSSPIGLALCRMDGDLVRVNSAYSEIVGRSVADTLQLTYWQLTPEKYADQEQLQLQSLKEKGRYGPYEKEYIRSDGSLVPVCLHGRLIEQRGESYIWSTVEDISSRRRMEAALQQEQKSLQREKELAQGYLDVAGVMLTVIDEQGQVTLINAKGCEILGYGEAEIIGRNWFDTVIPENMRAQVKDVFLQLMAGTGALVEYYENRVLRKDGEERVIAFHNAIIREHGKIVGVVSSGEDVTERKREQEELAQYRIHLEEEVLARTLDVEETQAALLNLLDDMNLAKAELEQANDKLKDLDRLKSMFIASMSHELRTPLNSVIGFTGLILGDMVGDISDEQRDMLSRVSRAGKHLLSLVTDVIDIAKIESGKIVPYAEAFLLSDLIDEALDQIAAPAAEKGLTIRQQLPKNPLSLHTDRRHLLQCLLNYLSNAVKFSEQGTVTIAVALGADIDSPRSSQAIIPAGWVEIRVSDTGIGIAEAGMKRLFGSFVRLETPLKTTIPGTGLGLYLTKKLATEVLGGQVGAESQEGQGSSFWIRLPLVLPSTEI